MSDLPSGTVTFLFTDIEGSTRMWEEHPDVMRAAFSRRHDEILESVTAHYDGSIFSRMGDGMAMAFGSASKALTAAIAVQENLFAEPWPTVLGRLSVRMGIHTGDAMVVDEQYLNPPLNRCARLMAIGHGGQVLVSGSTELLVHGGLPEGVELIDLGDQRLRDLFGTAASIRSSRLWASRTVPTPRSPPADLTFPRSHLVPLVVPSESTQILGRIRPRPPRHPYRHRWGRQDDLALQLAADRAPHFPAGAVALRTAPASDIVSMHCQVGPVWIGVMEHIASGTASLIFIVIGATPHPRDQRNTFLTQLLDRREPAASVRSREAAYSAATSREALDVAGDGFFAF